jgi:hypothetical protein
VSRRLALVELLPEAIQQQVREGKIAAHLAMKFLVPVARIGLDDCQRMAAVFSQHHCDTRQAGQLYAAWRDGSPAIRKRILDEPELFFKAQRQVEPQATAASAAQLGRDLEMVLAIVNRAGRRLGGAVAEMDRNQLAEARGKIDRIQSQLHHLAGKIQAEEQQHVEPSATNHDSGTELALNEPTWLCLSDDKVTSVPSVRVKGVTKRESARILGISRLTVRKVLRSNSTTVPEHPRAEKAEPYRQQILELLNASTIGEAACGPYHPIR